MKKITVYQVDSFTKEKFSGNPAGVVLNAESLSEKEMGQIARELNNSETAFILSPQNPGSDLRVRYFTPATEVPICGHATIGAMYVKAVVENQKSGVYITETKAGVLPFEVVRTDDDYEVIMTQGNFSSEPPFEGALKEKILSSFGLRENDTDPRCPVQIVSTGHSKVMIGIKEKKKLNSLKPDFFSLSDISNEIKCNGYYVFVLDEDNDDILVNGRMFAPAIGINEDPVTGNANGPLGAYLISHKIIEPDGDLFEFKAMQGEKMGRPGVIKVTVGLENNRAAFVKVSGTAVIVFHTEIEI